MKMYIAAIVGLIAVAAYIVAPGYWEAYDERQRESLSKVFQSGQPVSYADFSYYFKGSVDRALKGREKEVSSADVYVVLKK